MKPIPLFLLALALMSLACTLQLSPIQQVIVAPQLVAEISTPDAALTPTLSAQVTATSLNIRSAATYHSAAGKSTATGKYKYKGQTIIILECVSGWARIGADEWVRAYYLNRGCR